MSKEQPSAFRRFMLNNDFSKPRDQYETQYIRDRAIGAFNDSFKSIIEQYNSERSVHDPELKVFPDDEPVPAEIDQTISRALSSIENPVQAKRKLPFIPRGIQQYVTPKYDLLLVSTFAQSEPIFNRVIRRYVEQITKQDFQIISQNKENLSIVLSRIRDLEVAMSGENPSEWTFKKFIRKIATNLVTYGISYVHRLRDNDSSTGKQWQLFGNPNAKTIDPIAGLFVEDPVIIRTKLNHKSKIVKYLSDHRFYDPHMRRRERQYSLPSFFESRRFNLFDERSEDVVTFEPGELDEIRDTIGKDDLVLPMPLVWPIIPDIKALRMMEENVELLVYQFSHGVMQGKVGSEKFPVQPGEVKKFRELLDQMEGNGSIVTDHRHTLEMVGIQGAVMDVIPYIDWFVKRIFMGFGVNPSVMGLGESTNKASGTSLDKAFQGSVVTYQKIIEEYLTGLFDHFLYESGVKYWEINDQNRVYAKAPETDIDKETLKHNDTIQQWTNNAISFNEMRKDLGQVPIPENDGKFYKDFVTMEQLDREGEIEKQNIAAKLRASTSSNQNTIRNKTQPANQTGRRSGPKTSS